ncbi:MAG: methylenetetrahydrofolate--tRNA-(uracil(54)-C(5))-methyltransferase (FADH(2)-oxidizing) TrmFO [Clostridiales bacterium]|nr:methylenetetrahydrofolate--tRNA-(uracil(54)-C(5))-methyltransferase (FADH(2)-oxidizing) TrmFO [Bacillota bacterium]NLL54597.1 methylenetetrahydrofolate--tRNA-(uracil(54)-C(5))-methyltransferase (FADH(2)-oxidizing) TrmFO [Clostridiales bacterium]
MKRVCVVGAGLAGCEASWQLAQRGVRVELFEMKPLHYSPAHRSPGFAELVCSNSLKAEHLNNASGLLKAEMEKLDSLILRCGREARVPAGGALAVDREVFSALVTRAMEDHPLITIRRERVTKIPAAPAIIATGPLTDEGLCRAIEEIPGMSRLHFFDAAAPIVLKDSLDMNKVFAASRYGRGDGNDYLNCPMDEDEYNAFYDALVEAETSDPHGFEKKLVFDGCLAVEILASRGRKTLCFGPLKPVGLVDPRTGKRPYAVVQLRQENLEGTLYNMVGFQTRLKWGEQKRVFSMIPGLNHAEFVRYGVMHRNTYLNSPDVLTKNYALASDPSIRFAGQITGVEGYMESACSGLIAGLSLACRLKGREEPSLGKETVIGALEAHVRTRSLDFQPMNANFGILTPLQERIRNKKERYLRLAQRSLTLMDEYNKQLEESE